VHYFLADLKRIELLDKYDELKKSGRFTKFMEKRRKRNAAKDRRKLPSRAKQAERQRKTRSAKK